MTFLFFAFLPFLAFVQSIPAPAELAPRDQCSAPVRDTCTFYRDCLETRYHCGASGYPIGYGEHYCQAFTAAKSKFDENGKRWISDTMLCLQKALVPEATGAKTAVHGCDALSHKAFSTHANCYVDSGLCLLGPADWLAIIETVGLKELVSSCDAIKQTLITAGKCIEFFAWLAEQVVCDATGICF